MTEGTPTSMNNFFNSSHTAFAVKDFSRYTAGHLVHESTMHKQYLRPAADVGSIGPTTSIVICLKAVSSLGIEVISTLSFRMASCITCSPSSSASSNKFAIGNPLSLMSSLLSSDSNKLSLSHASFSCLILSNIILDSSSLVSSLSFSFFSSSSLSSSSLAFASSRSFCNLCARVITFAFTSSSCLMIRPTCGMAFNSAMLSGCSKNFSLLPIPAIYAHTNETYSVIVNFTLFALVSSSVSHGVSHHLTSIFTNLAGIASPATPCKLTSPTRSKFNRLFNRSVNIVYVSSAVCLASMKFDRYSLGVNLNSFSSCSLTVA